MRQSFTLRKISIILCFAPIFFGCANNEPKIEEIGNNVPDWVYDIQRKTNFQYQTDGMIWVIGTGNSRSSVKASCELAKFNALADLYILLSNIFEPVDAYIETISRSSDDPSQKELVDTLNLYQTEFYRLLANYISQQAAFALSEFAKVEKRAIDSNGTVWCLLSFKKGDVQKIPPEIFEYAKKHYQDWVTRIDNALLELSSQDG
jgi:hypothetical protein